MALRSFEQVAASPSFLSMPIAFVRALILDDKLIAREEEPVFEVGAVDVEIEEAFSVGTREGPGQDSLGSGAGLLKWAPGTNIGPARLGGINRPPPLAPRPHPLTLPLP
eukprot:scaffold20161_cov51-Isochrysis_galbana.AAC.1